MNQQMHQHFVSVYANQSNEELIHTAATMDLVPEAKVALDAELKKRGTTEEELHSYRQILNQDAKRDVTIREEKLSRSKKATDLKKWTLYAASALMCLWGLILILFPELKGERDDGGLFVAMGVAGFIFGWLSAKLSMLWARIQHR